MNSSSNKPFVHILLFECPQCASPVSSALASDHRNMEQIDSTSIPISCTCGWRATLPATNAKRHWVETWPSPGRIPEHQHSSEHRNQVR
jgi:hypothetical protein